MFAVNAKEKDPFKNRCRPKYFKVPKNMKKGGNNG